MKQNYNPYYLVIPIRYLVVISLGMEAMHTGDPVDYARYYQQWSDVCMLRLFDSFLESAPQLVFHLYVMMVRNGQWPWEQGSIHIGRLHKFCISRLP